MIRFNPFFLLILFLIVFFAPFFFLGKLPVPSDTLLGLYHPFRDVSWDGYREVPYKNFLITDPVLQQIPWRIFTIEQLKDGRIPLWNPYNFSGTPHLANSQSATFSPFNILFFILPFKVAWGVLIILQPFLGGLFLYLYLRFFNLAKTSSLLGALAFSFSGFFVSWLEWGTVLYAALFLPLSLLAVEKLRVRFSSLWFFIFIGSLLFSIFAGHLQTTFYVYFVSFIYLLLRTGSKKIFWHLLLGVTLSVLIAQVQLLPTFEFVLNSARGDDLLPLPRDDWFLPPIHLIQILAPDFFGNPATLNYWGVFNYGEFVSYVGIIPLIFSLYAIFFRRDNKTFFATLLAFFALLVALPNPISQLPFSLKIPFLASSQPSRVIFLFIFSLSVLCALGFDHFYKKQKVKSLFVVLIFFFLVFGGLFISTYLLKDFYSQEGMPLTFLIARRNLFFPIFILLLTGFSSIIFFLLPKLIKLTNEKAGILKVIFIWILVGIAFFDLWRFAKKFTPFVRDDWFYPKTQTISFLKENLKGRVLTLDRRIFPPNLSAFYQLPSLEGYDPLYIRSYGELLSIFERGEVGKEIIKFNRILRPQNVSEQFLKVLGVSHVLAFEDERLKNLPQVFKEGETRTFAYPKSKGRAFIVSKVTNFSSREEELQAILTSQFDYYRQASVSEDYSFDAGKDLQAQAQIVKDLGNEVIIKTQADNSAFLVLLDNYYPGWKATVNGRRVNVHQVNYTFKGVAIPEGESLVRFYFDPVSFKIGGLFTFLGLVFTVIYLWIRKRLVL